MSIKLEKMYQGIPNSPKTVLTQPINETETTIHIEDSSVFPEAPNIAVIGMDEEAETILYNTKSGNMLSGVQRGLEGIAKSWNEGEDIGRNWTNKDYSTLINNINVLKDNAEQTINNISEHSSCELPHIMNISGTTYKYGFRVDAEGSLIFVYEEVSE